ncbi:MAG: PilT/PilU family type 4a pilus ATPase [Caldithrix sp.]|nr:PilT/PilU family type 4a pilus ATPase [Caldithrix sp.]
MSDSIFEKILRFAAKNNASDVHFVSGMPPIIRLAGGLKRTDTPAIKDEQIEKYLDYHLSERQKKRLVQNEEVDLAIDYGEVGRFRVNIYRQMNGLSAAFRIIPQQIRKLEELRLPDVLHRYTKAKKGLILVTGPTGSGKSTTLAALIDEINRTRKEHIITIEDPIEYLHKPQKCLINQREVGNHTQDFATALKYCLREDPDVILVGEMRDLETITNALRAAETGHLVFSTMHTNSAADTVDRIISVFPPEEQRQVRQVVAAALLGVISQRLIPSGTEMGRIATLEILNCTPAVRNLVREGKTHQIESVIQTGTEDGMQTFERSVQYLKQNNLIAPDITTNDII